ncbi:FkbM family methyltransferase [bacterium]|jgi:hypothetical protein|nr:FkbM family methyltransferase [bacterium]
MKQYFKRIINEYGLRAIDLSLVRTVFRIIRGRWNIVLLAQKEIERGFFCTSPFKVKSILDGVKLNIVDIGSRGGVENGLLKYIDCMNVSVVEPDEDAPLKSGDNIKVIRDIIGSDRGKSILNICKNPIFSSVLEPNGNFLDLYTASNTKGFSVEKRVTLKTCTLEDVIMQGYGGVDYLKLDTQGSEFDILQGIGSFRPLIIKTEISYVPLYKDQTVFFHLGKFLYDSGYVMFHTSYGGKSSPERHRSSKPYEYTVMPLHGDAWFMPDWTRSNGAEIISGREKQYKALMSIFGMKDLHKYATSYLAQL